tara:strand:- start:81 stop:1451 length:1371 start_codon:yes stop_codon:yes gene_type:complete
MDSVAKSSFPRWTPHLAVKGNCSLSGFLKVSGAKNSALVLMAASILSEEEIRLKNIPFLTDIDVMINILKTLGIQTKRNKSYLLINPKEVHPNPLPSELVHSLRASFFCIGPLLARFGKAEVPLPGGCQIGNRPIDEHIKGLRKLGAIVEIKDNVVYASLANNQERLKAANIILDCPSVGATETILMATVLSKGVSKIKNAAQEPEIQDLANMLNQMGAKIKGAGSSEINIEGVELLHGCTHTVIPDRIEAGTLLIAAAITRSSLIVGPIIQDHLFAVLKKLDACGCTLLSNGDLIKIIPGEINSVDITTNPFPGFPSDLQAPFMALMATAKGVSKITENIFENRMQHVEELKKMGASIRLNGSIAEIKGVPELQGHYLEGKDLRSSAAIVLASLAAKGESKISGLHHLDRGYEELEEKLNGVGAFIVRNQKQIVAKDVSANLLNCDNLTINQEVA